MAAICADESRLPGMIRMLATFHSNHVCAQIGEQASAERTGEYMSEIQNPDFSKRRGYSH
jgi:hypothetical protein